MGRSVGPVGNRTWETIAIPLIVLVVVLLLSSRGPQSLETHRQLPRSSDIAGAEGSGEAGARSFDNPHGPEVRLTDRRYPRGRPLIAGELVMWQEGPDIAVHDLDSHATGYLGFNTDTSLTAFDGKRYAIEVEVDDRRTGYVYDLASGGPPITLYQGLPARAHPVFSGDKVVWEERGHLSLYDFGADSFETIPTSAAGRPWLDGNRVAYQAVRNGSLNIYVYELDRERTLPVAVGPGAQSNPVVSGSWVLYTDHTSGNGDIYAFQLDAGSRHRLSSGPATETVSAIWSNRAVWHSTDGGGTDVYMATLPATTLRGPPGEAVRLSEGSGGSQRSPYIDSDRVVWQDGHDGGWDINLLTLSPASQFPLP